MSTLEISDLPLWMRRARQGTDWGVILAIAFSLTAAWAFLFQPGLPQTNSSENYVYRVADYAAALAEGRLYPRWSPNALYGYGAPIPHYYPPGAALPPALAQFILTGDPVVSVRLYYVALFVLAGSAVYALVARRAGAAAGVLSSVLYVYSPYIGLTAPHLLGDLPGFVGLALLPALLWSVNRLLLVNRPLDGLGAALVVAALFLTDIPSALAGVGLTTLFVLWHTLTCDRHAPWGIALLGLAIGAGLAACFTLPALLEANAVTWYPRGSKAPLMLTYGALFAPQHPVNLNDLRPLPTLTLGLPLLVCTALAGLAMLKRPPRPLFLFGSIHTADTRRLSTTVAFHRFFLLLGVALALAAPLLFPLQIGLLGVCALLLSIGAGAAVRLRELLPSQRRRLALPIAMILILIGSSAVWVTPSPGGNFPSTSAVAQVLYEQLGYGIAVLPADAPLPSTLPQTIPPNPALIAGYRAGVVNKVAQDQLGGEAQIGVLAHGTHADRFQIQLYAPRSLEIMTASFPGWVASLNGTPVPLQRSDMGFMEVDLPAPSTGELVLSLDTTPARAAGWVVTWASLLVGVLITVWRVRRSPNTPYDFQPLPLPETRLLATVFIGCALFLTFAPPTPSGLHWMPEGSTPLFSRVEGDLELMSYQLHRTSYHAGETVRLSLYWRALRPLGDNYHVRVFLLNRATGGQWLPTPPEHPGGYPTQRWTPNRFITDLYAITLPPDIPPGEYSPAVQVLRCGMLECRPDNALPFYQLGTPLGTTRVLPETVVIGAG